MKKKTKHPELERKAIEEIFQLYTASLENEFEDDDVMCPIEPIERNFEQVPHSLWVQVLQNHKEKFNYN